MSELDPAALARVLDEALLERREIQPLTKTWGDFDLETAYRIQRNGQALRAARGERIIGYKMGLTSEAKRRQMDLGSPIYGPLTDAMRIPADGKIEVGAGIHPRIEPEIAFVTGRELRGQISRAEALASCEAVAPALEVLDSRFAGFKYFSLPDVVADNCSSWRFILGRKVEPRDVSALSMVLRIDGKVVQEASSEAISGHPGESLVQLVAMLDAHGAALPAGSIVLAGAATAAEPLRAGMKIELLVEGLSPLRVAAI